MWRAVGLVAIVVVISFAIACGDDDDDSDPTATPRPTEVVGADGTPDCNYLTPGPTFEQFIEASLKEASEMIGFQVLQPEEIPKGASLAGPFVLRSGSCPEDVLEVQVMVRGQDYTIIIAERPVDAAYSDLPEAIQINGVEGTINRQAREDGPVVTVMWADDERRFTAHLPPGGSLTEDKFLEILESIPE